MTSDLKYGFLGAVIFHVILFSMAGWISTPSYAISVSPQVLEVNLVRQMPVPPKSIEIKTVIDETVPAETKKQSVTQKVKQTAQQVENLIQGAFKKAEPKKDINEAPYYPREARRKGYEGRVLLKVRVSAQGRVDKVDVAETSGYEILDASAVKAVQEWVFKPAHLFGKTIQNEIQIPVIFKLEK